MRLPNKASNPIGARWDKLKSWKTLRDDIEDKLQTADNLEEAITLDIGPQLLHTIRHPSSLRCTDHTSSKLGEMFTTHYNKGAVQSVKIWTLESKDKNGVCKNVGFETECEITSMTYVSKHRVYLVFCMDLTLRVFTISNNNFVEVQSVPRLDTILCLIYNKEDDEIYAGGIGFLEEWRVQGAEHAASVIPGRKFVTDLTRNEWIRDIQIDRHNNQMYAMHGAGICVVNFKTRKEMHRVPNKHEGPMKCCCYYPQSDCLVTGGADGRIKLFNSTVFNLLHVFMGHHGPVTGLVPHKKDSLLFSCSHDGTVRIWRMDSLQMFMRLDIGEKIMNLSLLGDSEFYFLTDKNILIYSLNQFYEIFAPVESETKKLICSRGKGKPNRILGSTEDGSVRLFSPVTGLTLTIIYPMPSFQVLSSFAYDIHQDRLHTVLFEGKVLVYNTATNPCTADEVWLPSCEDEEVHNLLLVTVEFMCDDGVTDMDNLVFAGLKNGQIILCEAVVCSLDAPIQAHEGALTCLESCLHMAEGSGTTVGLLETCGVIISGGTDNFVKVWTINITTESHRPIVTLSQIIKIYLPSFPSHVCMFSNLLSVCIKSTTSLGVRWRVVMFHLLPETHQRRSIWFNLDGNMSVMPLQVNHPPDEDHTLQLTALDKCPIMRIVLSAGKDGYVKIWSSQNELLREMNFATPLFASCFANDRGDILVGYGTHLCSVSVINYLPVEYLRQVADFACIKLEDDVRELPVKFDHQCEPWLDLNKLKKFSIDILERRRQHLEIEIIERLKRATEKEAETKFVIFVDGGKTKVIRKDFADRLLNWAKGKNKLNFGAFKKFADLSSLTEDDSGNQINIKKSLEGKTKGSRSNGAKLVKSGAKQASTNPEYLDSAGTIEIYPSTVGKALRQLGTQKPCNPLEMKLIQERELLKKDPIIAPDGYIPNSVIRKKLKPPQVDTVFRRVEKPFKLKPVPKVNPDHLPSWWGKEDEEKNTATPSGWEDSSVSERPDTLRSQGQSGPTSAVSDARRSPTKGSDVPAMKLPKHKPSTPSTPYQSRSSSIIILDPTTKDVKSKRMDLTRIDLDMGTPDSRRGRKSGRQSVERSRSFKLTNLAVDEDSSMIHVKDSKSGRRGKPSVSCEIIQKLMTEDWMPELKEDCEYEDVLDGLNTVLDNPDTADNPVLYDTVCNYVTTIFTDLGIPDQQLTQTIEKLGTNLNHTNTAIKKYTMKTLQVLGQGRNDVILLILPKLVDPDEPIRKAAAEAIQTLTGAQDKDTLLKILDELGITGGVYNSKGDEEYALSVLAERFAERSEDPQYFDRIQDWVAGTTPGLYDMFEEDGDNDPVWQEGQRSRKSSMNQKERSFLSDGGKSGRKDRLQTPRSKRTETGSTVRHKLQDIDGYSTISDRSVSSRKSQRSMGRFTPKDPHLYKYYDKKSQDGDSGGLPEEDEGRDKIEERDSDIHTISNTTSSQITERLSNQDSGIGRDMSGYTSSHTRSYARGGYRHGGPLSPVKSEECSPLPQLHRQQSPQDWRKFFELPNAVERRQMEQIKREMEQGKLKPSTLPPISYFAEDLPMLPGEAGTRLLQTVRVNDKVPINKDGKHRIESVPGKLAVHTQNEVGGLSNFGILQMQWTTGVPTVKDRTAPPQRIPQYRSHGHTQESYYIPAHHDDRLRGDLSEEELNLPHLASGSPRVTGDGSSHYEWDFPLPPPPAKESRTNVPSIKRQHDNYCKYYQLVKKKLHLYTSQTRESSLHLPEVYVKQIRERQRTQKSFGSPPLKNRRSPKSNLGASVLFPPIKLGQLIKIW